MAKYTMLAIVGVIVLLLGMIAFLGGVGQYQSQQRYDDRVADDRSRFERTNATGGYDVCAYDNATRSLTCPDNPYADSWRWLGAGLLTIVAGAGIGYYDFQRRE